MVRRVLVTGAAGFVGRHLLPVLAAGLPGTDIIASRFNLGDTVAIRATVHAAKPDACVHLAAVAAVSNARNDPATAWTVNLQSTLHSAQALLAEVPHCTMLFASTADAYGASFRAGVQLDESAVLAPMNTYSATKAAADLALGALAASNGLRVIRLRPFNHTGAGQTPDFVVPAFARQIARIAAGQQQPVLHVGDLESQRDFLDVGDVCDAYLRCLRRADDLAPGTILNLASGRPRRVGDVLAELISLAGITPRINVDLDRLRSTDIPVAIGNAQAAGHLLGWSSQIPWRTTLVTVMDYWHDQAATGSV